jgi:hypothetical protein
MVEATLTMVKLKGHWKLTEEQYLFCSKLLNLYRLHTGHKFNKRLRGWLFFNQERRLHAADFLEFLSMFDICAEAHCAKFDICARGQCADREICLELYNIISNRSDYSPIKTGDSDDSYISESPVLHGQAVDLLRLLDSFRRF